MQYKVINNIEESLLYVFDYCMKYVVKDCAELENIRYLTPREFCRQSVEATALLLDVDVEKARKIKEMLWRYKFHKAILANDVIFQDDFLLEFAELFDDGVLEGHTFEMLHFRTLAANDMVYKTYYWNLLESIFGEEQMRRIFTDPQHMIKSVLAEVLPNLCICLNEKITLRDFADMIDSFSDRDYQAVEQGRGIPQNGEMIPLNNAQQRAKEINDSIAAAMEHLVEELPSLTIGDMQDIEKICRDDFSVICKHFDISEGAAVLLSYMVSVCESGEISLSKIMQILDWEPVKILKLMIFANELEEKGYLQGESPRHPTKEVSYRVSKKTIKAIIDNDKTVK